MTYGKPLSDSSDARTSDHSQGSTQIATYSMLPVGEKRMPFRWAIVRL